MSQNRNTNPGPKMAATSSFVSSSNMSLNSTSQSPISLLLEDLGHSSNRAISRYLKDNAPKLNFTEDQLGARLVGRWKSGK